MEAQGWRLKDGGYGMAVPILCIHSEMIMRELIGLMIIISLYGILLVVMRESGDFFPKSIPLIGWIIFMGVVIVHSIRMLVNTLGQD